jgi:hypothetical protein
MQMGYRYAGSPGNRDYVTGELRIDPRVPDDVEEDDIEDEDPPRIEGHARDSCTIPPPGQQPCRRPQLARYQGYPRDNRCSSEGDVIDEVNDVIKDVIDEGTFVFE